MAAGGAPARQLRRGPAPIASFDHDVSDESSPETKQTFRLPEIREDGAGSGAGLAPPEQRARSHSSPAVGSALGAPPAPRIDISRASSSSHHDSRDSSPELALFAGNGADARGRLEAGFREDGALELRSSTEELAFLEGAPGPAPPAPAPAPASRRHSRKDSQGSEAALLGVSGRTSRLSSVGSQCSALSAFSHASRASGGRLSVVSGVSRSPSPHRMLLETSFCGPKPIETDPEICAAAVEERLLEIAKLTVASPTGVAPPPVDARDRREVRTEATVERPARAPAPPAPAAAPAAEPAGVAPAVTSPITTTDDDKLQKETQNRARAQERRARPRVRREPSEPEVYKSVNRTKNIIRIKLKPDDDYGEDEEIAEATAEAARKPASLELAPRARPADPSPAPSPARSPAPRSPAPRRDSRTPSPGNAPASRKSSFCSLFKSRETIASPDSPSDALRRKRSLTEGRSRSKSRERAATPSAGAKLRGSVLSLFRTPRRGAASPSPSEREEPGARAPAPAPPAQRRADRLKYYEDAKDGIIHIPLRTPPDEPPAPRDPRPASAPSARPPPERDGAGPSRTKPVQRTVLPDGSIIIPLRSPTEHPSDDAHSSPGADFVASPPESRSASVRPECVSPAVPEVPVTAPAPALAPALPPATSSAPVPDRPSPVTPAREATPEAERAEPPPATDESRRRRKERLVFTTHVGSREQVFSTQFSITKTPSVTSEMSGSFPSFAEAAGGAASGAAGGAGGASPGSAGARDSSSSELSSEAAPARGGSDVERRGLVVQESFEDELPYVPTTLPQERSLALPMVPVRQRAGVRTAPLRRPRARPAPAAPAPPAPAPPPAPPAPHDKLRIKLPRRPRTASLAAPPRPERPRPRSGSGSVEGAEPRAKSEWIDFTEVPERRKQPKRIQTLPAAAAGGVVFSYVEPEHCRCECHARGEEHAPLLPDHAHHSSTSAEGGEDARALLNFSAGLELLPDTHIDSVEPDAH